MISEKLKEIRKARGLNQRQFADLIGINYNSVWRLENNEYPPSYPTLKALVEKAKVNPAELF